MLTWRGPALMLFARAACAVGAQALVAAVFPLRASPTPWHDAEPWLPVYGTLIDAGCLALLWRLTRREGIRLFDLVGFERTRLVRDTCRPGAHPCQPGIHSWRHFCGRLVFVWDAHAAVSLRAPAIAGRSVWRAGVPVHLGADRADDLYRLSVTPLPGSLPEYEPGDLLSRSPGRRSLPSCRDLRSKFMAFALSSVPNTVLFTLLYLRLRRLVPLALRTP